MKKLLFLLLPLFGFSQTIDEVSKAIDNDYTSSEQSDLVEKLVKNEPGNPEAHYLYAKYYLKSNGFTYAEKEIDKAIEINPNNLEYRWLKVRTNLTSRSNKKNYEIAIENLNFMISKGVLSAKIYNAMGISEDGIANEIYRYTHPKSDDSFTDNNNQKTQQIKIYEDAIFHFKKAITNFEKANEIEKDYSSEKIRYTKQDIERLEKLINELKQ